MVDRILTYQSNFFRLHGFDRVSMPKVTLGLHYGTGTLANYDTLLTLLMVSLSNIITHAAWWIDGSSIIYAWFLFRSLLLISRYFNLSF